MTDRAGLPALPIVAVDVDGVLNREDPQEAARLGYRPHHYDGPGPYSQHLTGAVWLHPEHGGWLHELARGAQLVWCTRCNQLAATWIAPRLGLPDTWTHLPIDLSGVRFGHQFKIDPLFRYAGGRPSPSSTTNSAAKTHTPRGNAPTVAHPPCCDPSTRSPAYAAPISTPSPPGWTTGETHRSSSGQPSSGHGAAGRVAPRDSSPRPAQPGRIGT